MILAAFLLSALSVQAETATERCVAAREAATRAIVADSPTTEQTSQWRTAEQHAFNACTSREVPLAMWNEAVVRWAGTLNDTAAELELLTTTLRKTESGNDVALLPLIDRLAALYSIQPSQRREGLELTQRSLRIRRQAFGETSAEAVEGLILLGIFWQIEGMPDRNLPLAEQYLREAVTVAESACGRECASSQSARANLKALQVVIALGR